jgi:hypothetical protein
MTSGRVRFCRTQATAAVDRADIAPRWQLFPHSNPSSAHAQNLFLVVVSLLFELPLLKLTFHALPESPA